MKTQHTPGPWHVGSKEAHHCVYDSHGWQICDASPLGKDASTKANASLIASAPDLLKALRAVYNSTIRLSAETEDLIAAALVKAGD